MLHRNLRSALATLGLCLGLLPAAHAIVNDTPTSQFAAVGELGALSGVLVADNWVLTAAHVVRGVDVGGLTFDVQGNATAFADAIYMYPSPNGFPEHDIALVHLSTSVSAPLPVLYDTVLPNGTIKPSAKISTVTLVSPRNEDPAGKATATASQVLTTYTNPSTQVDYTTNWLLVKGNAYVENGDSGSALFKDAVNDTGTLLGIASGQLTDTNGSPMSAYVMVANYKSWINTTMASSGQQVHWLSAVPEVGSFWLMAAGMAGLSLLVMFKRNHGQMRYRSGLASKHPSNDGHPMVSRSHACDQESHHRAPQAH